jgi:hypothetical protein
MVSRQDFYNLFRKDVAEKDADLPRILKEMGVGSVRFELSNNYLNAVASAENCFKGCLQVKDLSGRKLYTKKIQIGLEPTYYELAGPLILISGMPKRMESVKSAELQVQREAVNFAKELEGQGIKVAYDSLPDLAYHLQ